MIFAMDVLVLVLAVMTVRADEGDGVSCWP